MSQAGTICVLSRDDVARYVPLWTCLNKLQVPDGTVRDTIIGHGIVEGLNASTEACLQRGHAWLWIMGDDHIFGADTLQRLLAHDLPIVAPLNVQRQKPFQPLLYASNGEGDPPIHQYTWKHLDHMAGLYKLPPRVTCGNAGMLIQREVLERLPEGAWWADRPGLRNSEDLYFCERVRAFGYEIYVDLDVRLGHMFTAAAIPVQKDTGEWLVAVQGSGKTIAHIRYI